MKKIYLFLLVMCASLSANAQITRGNDTGEVIDLLPDGVKVNVNSERKEDKQKNLVVAGAPNKGYLAFFAAVDSEHGEELWCSDGTPEGTHIVKDIVKGTGSSSPTYLGRLNDKVLFGAYSEETMSIQPWVSDGTEEGTFMLCECYMFGDADPKAFVQLDEGHAVFVAIDDESATYDPDTGAQYWLWITDGTAEGTHRVVDDSYDDDFYQEHQARCAFPGRWNYTEHYAFLRVGRRVFYKGYNLENTSGEELWITDGTPEGTYMVMDISLRPASSGIGTGHGNVDEFVNYKNERLFFSAYTFTYSSEPWSSDGYHSITPDIEWEVGCEHDAGDDHTYLIYDGHSGQDESGEGLWGDAFAAGWETLDNRVFFRGYLDDIGSELNWSNCEKGNMGGYDIYTTAPTQDHHGYADPGVVFQGYYIFSATTGTDASDPTCFGGELYYFDPETDEAHMVSDFCTGTLCDWVTSLCVCGGTAYWHNTENSWSQGFGNGLYRMDSVEEGPVVCNLIVPSDSNGDNVHTIRNLDGMPIYCSANTERIYCYKYTKPNWDGVTDKGYTEPVFDTEDVLMAIQSVGSDTATKEAPKGVYTLAGVKVKDTATDLQKGVYIVDGVKTIVK